MLLTLRAKSYLFWVNLTITLAEALITLRYENNECTHLLEMRDGFICLIRFGQYVSSEEMMKPGLHRLFFIKFCTNFTVMKKAIASVLVVVMLLVSFAPCADASGLRGRPAAKATVSSILHHLSGRGQDYCPPFCPCQCCTLVAVRYTIPTEFASPLQYQPSYSSQPVKTAVQQPHDVWQPPQL